MPDQIRDARHHKFDINRLGYQAYVLSIFQQGAI